MELSSDVKRSWPLPWQHLSKLRHITSVLMAIFLLLVFIKSLTPPKRPKLLTSDNSYHLMSTWAQRKASLPALSMAKQRDLTLSDNECRQAFPLLYPQLEMLEEYWLKRGGITKEMLDHNQRGGTERWGFVRLIISDGRLRIRAFQADESTRTSALVELIEKAIYSWPDGYRQGLKDLPDTDLVLSAGDLGIFPGEGFWGITRRIDDPGAVGQWLIPDFGFIGWPEAGISSFDDFLAVSAKVEKETPWTSKPNRLFWRGFPNVYAIRRDLMDRAGNEGHPERDQWSDIYATTFDRNAHDPFKPIVPIAEHCRQKYLVHAEGNSYSGRSRYLLACNAVMVAHKLVWTQHFHPALISDPTSSDQNYVELPGPGFEGIEESAYLLQESDGGAGANVTANLSVLRGHILGKKNAQDVARNAVRMFRHRYLSPAATMCYTRAALRSYAKVLNRSSWASEPFVEPGQGVGPDTRKTRFTGDERGDVEVGIWRILGTPDWPPKMTVTPHVIE